MSSVSPPNPAGVLQHSEQHQPPLQNGLHHPSQPTHSSAHQPAVIETSKITRTQHEDHPTWRMLNGYRINETIGQGQFGKVKHAVELATDKQVAIKIVKRRDDKKMLSRVAGAETRFRHEIAIMKKCQHDHIVRLFEVINDPRTNQVFLVMEYCEGGEILWHDRDDNPLLSLEQIRRIVRDVTLGLEYLHFNGIIHRDIKPANLLWTKGRARVKITDFGTAHYSPDLVTSKQARKTSRANVEETPRLNGVKTLINGLPKPSSDALTEQNEYALRNNAISPVFASPELCFVQTGRTPPEFPPGQRPAGVRTNSIYPVGKALDVWAFGVTFWCLLFGRHPWEATHRYALFAEIIEKDPEEPKQVTSHPFSTDPDDAAIEEETRHNIQEALQIMRGMMTKQVHARMALDEVKKSKWLDFDPEPPMEGERLLQTAVELSEDDATNAIKNRHAHPKRWPKFSKTRANEKSRSPHNPMNRMRQMQSSGHVNNLAETTSSQAEKDKPSGPARGSTDFPRKGLRRPPALTPSIPRLSAVTSPIVIKKGEHPFSKQQEKLSPKSASLRGKWHLPSFMKSFVGSVAALSKSRNVSASAEVIPNNPQIQTRQDSEDSQPDIETFSSSLPSGLDRKAVSVYDPISGTEHETENPLLITYDTLDESDIDTEGSILLMGAGGYGFSSQIGRGRTGFLDSSTSNSQDAVFSPAPCNSDGSLPTEPRRIFDRNLPQHTTGTPARLSRRDSLEDTTTDSPVSPASENQHHQWSTPVFHRPPLHSRPRSAVRGQGPTSDYDADSDSEEQLEISVRHSRRIP